MRRFLWIVPILLISFFTSCPNPPELDYTYMEADDESNNTEAEHPGPQPGEIISIQGSISSFDDVDLYGISIVGDYMDYEVFYNGESQASFGFGPVAIIKNRDFGMHIYEYNSSGDHLITDEFCAGDRITFFEDDCAYIIIMIFGYTYHSGSYELIIGPQYNQN